MVKANSKVSKILEITKSMPKEERTYLVKLLRDAPLWLFENISIQRYSKDKVFIHENAPVNQVFILIDGTVKAIERRIFGIEYDFMRFCPTKMFGAMEILLDIDVYKTTLATESKCVLLVMQRDIFKKWIQKDINAILMEFKSLGIYLLEQVRKERVFLFLKGKDRLFLVFIEHYERKKDEHENYVNTYTRQELSNCSGLSIKTINRAIKQMEKEGYIGRRRNKITISKKQYAFMKEYINNLILE